MEFTAILLKKKKALDIAKKNINSHLDDLKSTINSHNNENDKKNNNISLLMDSKKITDGVKENSLVYKRIQTINNLKEYGIKIDFDTLQKDIMKTESSSFRITFPEVAVNLSMTLGLLGTFVGLAIVVGNINALLPDVGTNPDKLIETMRQSISEMRVVFAGINIAFITSITGIISAISCLIFNYLLQHARISFLKNLEFFTSSQLLPVTVEAVENAHRLENIYFNIKGSLLSLEKSLEKNNKIITELSVIQQYYKESIDNIKSIVYSAKDRDIIELLKLTVEEFSKVALTWPELVKMIEIRFNKTDEHLSGVINTMPDFAQNLENNFASLENKVIETNDNLSGIVNYLPELNQKLEDNNIDNIDKKFSEINENISGFLNSLPNIVQRLNYTIQKDSFRDDEFLTSHSQKSKNDNYDNGNSNSKCHTTTCTKKSHGKKVNITNILKQHPDFNAENNDIKTRLDETLDVLKKILLKKIF